MRQHWTTGIWLFAMLFLTSCGIFASKPVPSAGPPSGATQRCTVDCISVSKSFSKEHHDLLAETIRLSAALAACQEKLR
jgi:hypothetical protein